MSRQELIRQLVTGQRLPLDALATAANLHVGLVERFVAYGLVEPDGTEGGNPWFDAKAVRRLQTIQRLRNDLGINLQGIAVALDLLERIEALQRELAEFRRT